VGSWSQLMPAGGEGWDLPCLFSFTLLQMGHTDTGICGQHTDMHIVLMAAQVHGYSSAHKYMNFIRGYPCVYGHGNWYLDTDMHTQRVKGPAERRGRTADGPTDWIVKRRLYALH
jgi:hypothetical protein